MMLRRVYSSIPSARAALSNANGPTLSSPLAAGANSARISTRGRIRPRMIGKASKTISTSSQRNVQVVASASSSSRANEGRGRKRPARSGLSFPTAQTGDHAHLEVFADEPSQSESRASKSSARLSFTHPVPALNHVNDFQPIYLYPEQFKLHTTFTHPHLPLPLYLGTNIYTSPRRPSSTSTAVPITEDLFAPPPPPDPAARLRRARPSGTGMDEHSSIMSALSHPSLLHHLGDQLPWGMPSPEMEFGGLGAVLESTAVQLNPTSSEAWSNTLNWLDGNSVTPPAAESEIATSAALTQSDVAVDSAVADLTAVLSKLGMSSARGRRSTVSLRGQRSQMVAPEIGLDVVDEGVSMDSVKRKRKKKISKHKYKKRRKATRALRKRLGK